MKFLTFDEKPIPHFFLKKGERLLYKLTTQENTTRNDTYWAVGGTNYAENQNPADTRLCTGDVLHAYEHPIIALIRNCQDADIRKPKLWLAKGVVVGINDGLKVGCKSMTTLVEMKIPSITTEQKIAFEIYAALEIYKNKIFILWAKKWLSGEDRSKASATSAADATYAAYAASAASTATYAAYTAYAASAAAYTAYAASATAYTAYAAAASAAAAATYATDYTAYTAATAYKIKPINFIKIAEKSMRIK